MLTKEDVVIILKIYNNQAQRVKGRILRTPQSSLAINGVSVTRCVFKQKKMRYLTILLIIGIFTSCKKEDTPIKTGEIRRILFTKNIAIGTDSTIVIINRDTGKTLNVIKRKQ